MNKYKESNSLGDTLKKIFGMLRNLTRRILAIEESPTNSVIEVTLAELQVLQFTDAPAPTGITITPDAVGIAGPPFTILFSFVSGDSRRSLISEPYHITGGSETTKIIYSMDAFPEGFSDVLAFIGSDNLPELICVSTNTSSGELVLPFTPNAYIYDEFLSLPILQLTNNLPLGQQYYVTDKNWLLYVDQPTVLKPVKGSLHIFNGETLPEGIEPDVLLIDTGIIDYEIPIEGNGLAIAVTNDYILDNVFVDNTSIDSDNTEVTIKDENSFYCLQQIIFMGWMGKMKTTNPASDYVAQGSLMLLPPYKLYCVQQESSINLRAILEFHRSELSYPIPVPHIVSAEGINARTVQVVFDNLILNYFDTEYILINENIISGYELTDNIMNIFANEELIYGNVITISFLTGAHIKTPWGGLLAEVVDYPVVNNVPNPFYVIGFGFGDTLVALTMSLDVSTSSLIKEDFTITHNGVNNAIIGIEMGETNLVFLQCTNLFEEGDSVFLSFVGGNLMDVTETYYLESFTNVEAGYF